jgi:hypothetical protein
VTRDGARDMKRPLGVCASTVPEITVAAVVLAKLDQQGLTVVQRRTPKETVIVGSRVFLPDNCRCQPRSVGAIAPILIILRVSGIERSWVLKMREQDKKKVNKCG